VNGEHIFQSALKDFLDPPDFDEPDVPTLPPLGTCPQCRAQLEWDGVDDTKAWCPTPGCKYDNGISEEANRELWKGRNRD